MAIKIEYDRICIGSFVLCEDANGVAFDGIACANEFCDTRTFGGTVSGYTSGGEARPSGDCIVATIDKFSFAADGNATSVGGLSQARSGNAGQSSAENGYTSGGISALSPTPTASVCDTIDKFPFSADTPATDVGDLTQARYYAAGQSSFDNGYTSGGWVLGPVINTIDKFPFATDTNATDAGDLTVIRYIVMGQSSPVNGYTSGGISPPTVSNIIDKFPFAADANATDVGDLFQALYGGAGQSSTVSGYQSGGAPPPAVDTIQKFPFATDANATDVGNLTLVRRCLGGGQSSTQSGYATGGTGGSEKLNVIDKFPFSSDTNASDVGDLTQGRDEGAGQQV